MRLNGIDHITGITADGQRCLDFYAGILGLAFLGRDQDFEAPGSHLIRLGHQPDRPDGVLTFIEAPGLAAGRRGQRDGPPAALERSLPAVAGLLGGAALGGRHRGPFAAGGARERRLRFADPEGLEHELAVERAARTPASRPARARSRMSTRSCGSPESRAYGRAQRAERRHPRRAGSASASTGPDSYAVGAGQRSSEFAFDAPPLERGRLGAGTIHHIAWATDGFLPAWRQRVIGMGCVATPVIDRGHCRSIYFREPSGVLFEIAAPSECARGGVRRAGRSGPGGSRPRSIRGSTPAPSASGQSTL